jgi:hypothetical protein
MIRRRDRRAGAAGQRGGDLEADAGRREVAAPGDRELAAEVEDRRVLDGDAIVQPLLAPARDERERAGECAAARRCRARDDPGGGADEVGQDVHRRSRRSLGLRARARARP